MNIEYKTLIFFNTDVGADVLDLAETMVASTDGLVYEPVSLIHMFFLSVLSKIVPSKKVLIIAFNSV